jgi:hypothetical protein
MGLREYRRKVSTYVQHFDAAEGAPSTASKADMRAAIIHVRFAPDSDRKSGHAAMVMSALPPKADMCSALTRVRFGPKADMTIRPAPLARHQLDAGIRACTHKSVQHNDTMGKMQT